MRKPLLSAHCHVFYILVLINTIHGLLLPINQEARQLPTHRSRRESNEFIAQSGNGSIAVANVDDRFYNVNVVLGGAVFTVGLDTGSSDLWVSGDVPSTKNVSAQKVHLDYAGGTVSGSINTAELTLGSFTVSDQAYLKADTAQLGRGGANGILGIGPSSISAINKKYSSSKGEPFLSRIFKQNATLENYFTIFLSRSPDVEPPMAEAEVGQFTLGEVIPLFEDIVNTSKLPVINDQYHSQRWEILLDANGVIGPDGEKINTTTRIKNPQSGAQTQLRVAFDSGFTMPQLPRNVVDAIYGRVPGALFYQNGSGIGLAQWTNFWTIPYELNISFIFANQAFPIAPLDLTLQGHDPSGNDICAAREMDEAIIQDAGFGALDMILGEAFLRNTYMLVHVGDLMDESSGGNPYIQLLSTADKRVIHEEFVAARLNGIDTTGSQPALLGQSQAQQSPPPLNSTGLTPIPAGSSSPSNGGSSDYQQAWFIFPVTFIWLASMW
ncbi:acid protease [Gymnopus androsaceus JB14]|uniref:Acid protease n=1 Tax=Gymnopus androsaceus JB14 TaxID=1447944 RepID=A0A6A4H6W1_9AGAR|nr:acid protease [Gymnopus androsaceus JB14]